MSGPQEGQAASKGALRSFIPLGCFPAGTAREKDAQRPASVHAGAGFVPHGF